MANNVAIPPPRNIQEALVLMERINIMQMVVDDALLAIVNKNFPWKNAASQSRLRNAHLDGVEITEEITAVLAAETPPQAQ